MAEVNNVAQGLRQAAVRAATLSTNDYNGDFYARFAQLGLVSGNQTDFNGRLLAYINLKLAASFDNLPGAMAAMAAANGAVNFSSMGTFTV